jgi:hypothetical protein
MSSTHNKATIVCMSARHTQKIAFSCACFQNMSLKSLFLVCASPLNKSEAFSLIEREMTLREAEQ